MLQLSYEPPDLSISRRVSRLYRLPVCSPSKRASDHFSRANRVVVESLEQKHPNIRLEVVSGLEITGAANESGLTLAMAGGMSPDVIYVNLRKMRTYVEQGFLYPLDEFIAED